MKALVYWNRKDVKFLSAAEGMKSLPKGKGQPFDLFRNVFRDELVINSVNAEGESDRSGVYIDKEAPLPLKPIITESKEQYGKEATLSSQIEGTQAAFSDLIKAEAGMADEVPNDVKEIENYIRAIIKTTLIHSQFEMIHPIFKNKGGAAIRKRLKERYPDFEYFHEELRKHPNLNLQYLWEDYKSYIATPNQKSTLAKRGHNKQKRYDLRQYSLAVVTTKDVLFPMCSHVYEGNINDQTEFPLYLDLLKARVPGFDAKTTTLVYDGGSNNKANLAKLKGMGLHYICALSLSSCKELYDIALESYEPIKVQEREVLCYRLQREIWGQDRECLVIYSPKLFEGQMRELENDLLKNQARLAALVETIKSEKSRIKKDRESIKVRALKEIKGHHQCELFDIKIEGDTVVTDLSWQINTDKKNEIIDKYFGKKLLISDHQDWSTQEILLTYSNQYLIERIFRDTKNPHHFSIRPQYHWTDLKTRVHIFCCLLGLVLTALLRKEMEDNGIVIENGALIDELTKIRECWVFKKTNGNKSGLKIEKHIEVMDVKQAEIWKVISSL